MLRINRLLVLLVLLTLVGCSSAPVKLLPFALGEKSEAISVKLETPSRLVVLRPVPKGKTCDAKSKDLVFEVRGAGVHGPAAAERSCSLQPKFTTVRSKTVYAKGEYEVTADARTIVSADPVDPEALSGADQDFAGALELAENATLKGSVSYAGANLSNWVKVGGAKGAVSLLLLAEPGAELDAKIYQLSPGAMTPQRVGALTPKAKRTVSAEGSTLYVKITAKHFGGEAPYTLVRRDLPKVKATSLTVMDFYPVDGKSTVLLLPTAEGMKAQATLRVTGTLAGKTVSFGRCVVTALSPTQASCRLESVPAAGVSKLRAEWVQEGGAT